MKFTCTKENLLNVLQQVSGITNKHTNLPILNNVLFQVKGTKVDVSATNLEMALKANLRAKVEEEGSFTIPAKTLLDYVNLLPEDQIMVGLLDNELEIVCGNSKTKIKGDVAEDYPVIPNADEKHGFVVSVEDFKDSLSKVIVAASKNEIRPELAGIYFGFFCNNSDGLTLAATDSYRLAEKKIKVLQGDDSLECIVPAKTVQEIIRLVSIGKNVQEENNVRLWFGDNQISVRYSNFEMTSRLVDGKYPDYSQIIPKEFKTSTVVSVSDLIRKIKAASLFTSLGVSAVSFVVDGGQLKISSASTQTGEHQSVLDAITTGENNSVLLNHKYVLDGLQQISEDDVVLNINSGDTPCLLRPKKDKTFLYIVMPVRQ